MAEAQAAPKPDEWADFKTVQPGTGDPEQDWGDFGVIQKPPTTSGQRVGTFAGSATREALQLGGAGAGMVAGAGIGALGGPVAPVTVPLGAAIGFGAGYLGGEGIADIGQRLGLVAPPPEQVPEDLRPYAYAGQVVGGALPIAAGAATAARAGARLPASAVGGYINRILDFAAEFPKTFFASEMGMASAAAVAEGVTEAYRPGQTGERLAAGVAAGFLSPHRFVIATGNAGFQGLRRAAQSLSQAGRETAAGQVLNNIVRESGEDADVLVRLLRESGIDGTNLTAGQLTGSPALIALETKLAKESGKYGVELARRAEEGFKDIQNMITALRATGDPAALAEAADLRMRYFRTLIAGRVQVAEREAMDAAGRITGDSPRDMAGLSKKAGEALSSAMDDARAVEMDLWSKVTRDTPAGMSAIGRTYDNIRASLLPEEKLPEIVEGFITRMRGEGATGATNTGELILLRSRLLALAKESAGQGKANDARVYGELAEAALDDLDVAFGRGADEAYTSARTFSRELHDHFTRTFAGDTLAVDKTGAARIPPELLLRRATAGGREAAELRLREIEEATGFVASHLPNSPEAAANVTQMLDAQSRVLRLMASEAVDPNSGRVSTTRLGRFLRDNEAMLDKFPEVRKDLQAALKSEQALESLETAVQSRSKWVEAKSLLGRLTNVENPSDLVTQSVNGANPEGQLGALARLARRGGVKATDGLRSSVIDYALDKATSTTGELSLPKLHGALFEPMQAGSRSVMDVMVGNGVISRTDAKKLGDAFERAGRIANAAKGNKALDEVIGDLDAFSDLIARVAGARLGAVFAEGGPSLIAASRGSQFARNVIGKIPAGKVTQVLREATLNPRFMVMLLEQPKTQAEGIRLARQIHAYLWQTGVEIAAPEGAPAETEEAQ